jgi:two-component system cell cycle response regulator
MAPGSSFDIGRAPMAEISLPDVMSVSREHARLHYSGDVVTLEDLNSTNGTYINDHVLTGRIDLHSGDRFQVGTVHFKFLRERDPEHAYHRAIYQLVTHDGPTQIYNKRKFDEESQRELARARRYGRPLSLVLFDIDHFKAVNDRFGHLCGDFVLKRIAGLCSALLRPEQVIARVGGEEFAVLCPETRLEGAGHLAERLRKSIAEAGIEFAGARVPIHCSFGVAGLHSDTDSFDDLFAEADAALYRSKNEGRNRTTLGRPTSGSIQPVDPQE